MSNTHFQPGKVLTLTAPTGGVVAGTPYKIGSLFVIARTTAAQTLPFSGVVVGVHTLLKTSAQAWAEGDRLYWNAGTSLVSNLPADGMFIGFAVAAAANPSASGKVLLVSGAELAEGAQAAVADVATADSDATYGAAESTLINEMKTQFNALLARLRLAGIIAP